MFEGENVRQDNNAVDSEVYISIRMRYIYIYKYSGQVQFRNTSVCKHIRRSISLYQTYTVPSGIDTHE